MQLSPIDSALNMQLTAMDADLHTYGFPPGYFVIRSAAANRLLDVDSDEVADDTEIILYPETESSLVESMRKPESNNQVFFIDTTGALCSRSSGHAIDVADDRLVLRHRRPVSHPFPNEYSHPLPRFSYSPDTGNITVTFAADPTYPDVGDVHAAQSDWKDKVYLLTSLPLRKPRTLIDDATAILSSAISVPLMLLGAKPASPTADDVFTRGEVELREDEILEQDRTEEGEVDDSPERTRRVCVIATSKEDERVVGEKAKLRRQWIIYPLRTSKGRTGAI